MDVGRVCVVRACRGGLSGAPNCKSASGTTQTSGVAKLVKAISILLLDLSWTITSGWTWKHLETSDPLRTMVGRSLSEFKTSQ